MNSFQELNRNNLVAYFQQGAKPCERLGFELEHILLHKDTLQPVSYSQQGGVHDILKRLAPAYTTITRHDGDIIGLEREGEAISIEPAGQLEISIGPAADACDLQASYQDFRNRVDPILDEFGLFAPMLGYHPSACARDLELVPKFRYECMTKFLGEQSYSGICMMRGSASLQVSVDYSDEQDAMKKLRIAHILSPVLSLMCDNSPVYEQQRGTGHIARTTMWAGMNQDRVGTVPGSLQPGFSFADYADYILTREAILVPDANEAEGWRYVGAQNFDAIYADREMSVAELEHALTMVWPDARLKSFVEIRPADALPLDYALAYATLIRSLFYQVRNLDVLDEQLEGIGSESINRAKQDIARAGYDAAVYGRTAAHWAELLIELAEGSTSSDDRAFLEPLSALVRERRSLAEQ